MSISPSNNSYLLGHKDASNVLFEAWKNNHLHNSWIFSGAKGIGKATLAYKFARFLLNNPDKLISKNIETDVASSVFSLVSKNSHPDFKVLERGYIDTEKRKILKAIKSGEAMGDAELDELKKSAYIRVDEVRDINSFLRKKSSMGGWRVVIIDAVDDLNVAGANAILKILEEPPVKSIIILISHNSEKLLPTILSRCANLSLKPLSDDNLSSLIRRYRPEVTEFDILELLKVCSGSISKAMEYIDGDALVLQKELADLVYSKDLFSTAKLIDFCNNAVRTEEKYSLVCELILKFIAGNMKNTDNIIELSQSWDYAIKVFDEVDKLNLDKKQSLINIIYNIIKSI